MLWSLMLLPPKIARQVEGGSAQGYSSLITGALMPRMV